MNGLFNPQDGQPQGLEELLRKLLLDSGYGSSLSEALRGLLSGDPRFGSRFRFGGSGGVGGGIGNPGSPGSTGGGLGITQVVGDH